MMRDPDLTLTSFPEMLWTVPITGMIGSLDGELCCPEKWLETGGTAITKIASRTTFNERAITTTFYADVRSRSRQHLRRENRHTGVVVVAQDDTVMAFVYMAESVARQMH